MKRTHALLLVLAAVLSLALPTLAQDSNDTELVKLVAATDAFAGWLDSFPGWQGAAYYDGDNGTWYVEFYDAAGEEWLGYATVVDGSEEIVESFAPRPLPPDELQAGQARIHALILEDPEIQALLVDPILWDIYVDFNRWDQVWQVWMTRGIDAWVVNVTLTENYFSIDEIADGRQLEEEDAVQAARDEAIALTYSAPVLEGRLDGHDDWHVYAEQHGSGVWSVAFVSDSEELFYALVDIDTDSILETSAR